MKKFLLYFYLTAALFTIVQAQQPPQPLSPEEYPWHVNVISPIPGSEFYKGNSPNVSVTFQWNVDGSSENWVAYVYVNGSEIFHGKATSCTKTFTNEVRYDFSIQVYQVNPLTGVETWKCSTSTGNYFQVWAGKTLLVNNILGNQPTVPGFGLKMYIFDHDETFQETNYISEKKIGILGSYASQISTTGTKYDFDQWDNGSTNLTRNGVEFGTGNMYYAQYRYIPYPPTNLYVKEWHYSGHAEIGWTPTVTDNPSFPLGYYCDYRYLGQSQWRAADYCTQKYAYFGDLAEVDADPLIEFRVRSGYSINGDTFSDWTYFVIGTPKTPTGIALSSSVGSNGPIKVTWDRNPDGVDAYEVSRKVMNYPGVWEVVVPSTTSNSWIDNEYIYAPGGGQFNASYRVRAYASSRYSNYSNTASVQAESNFKIGISDAEKNNTGIALEAPTSYSMDQNYPNPFNPSTMISYSVPNDGPVSLKVYDMAGHEVASLVDGYKSAGRYNVKFDASKLSSGIYLYKIQAGTYSATKKMQLLK